MYPSPRLLLLGLLIVSTLPADPPPLGKSMEITVTPAPAARNLYRWLLMPGLVQRKPGDALEVYKKAMAAMQEVEPDRMERGKLMILLSELQAKPLAELDRKQVTGLVKRYQKPLDLIAEGARCEQANWDFVTERLRKSGLRALLEELQQTREFLAPLHLQARHFLMEDRPEKAVEVAATGLSLGRQVSKCPTLIAHLVALAITQISLDIVQEAIQHPKCPGLYGSLTDLPRPLVPIDKAYEGERVMMYGTVPNSAKLLKDPLVELPAETTDQLVRLFRGLRSEGGGMSPLNNPIVERIALATAMKSKHPLAVKTLKANGYDEATIAKMPILNASLLHSLLDYEEALGKQSVAARLPYPQAQSAFEAIRKQYPTSDKTPPPAEEPAFPLARFMLPSSERIQLADTRVARRLEVLRTAEALRQHAATTGKWPEKLDDVKEVLAVDPVTLKPFEYKVEGDVAILSGPLPKGETNTSGRFPVRITLRKSEEKKP